MKRIPVISKTYYIDYYKSPLGDMTLASNGTALTGLWFDNQKYFAAELVQQGQHCKLPVFEATKQWLELYFTGIKPTFTPPLAPEGSDFRQAVWKLLQEIPYGSTTTYGCIAAQLAQAQGLTKMSAQAVGGAVGHNPISIIIPCHRVVGTNGSLIGYAGGLDKKQALLKLEHTKEVL